MRRPATNTVLDGVSLYHLFEDAPQLSFRFRITARSCESLSHPFLNKIVNRVACFFHRSQILLPIVAWEFDDERGVATETVGKGERGSLLRDTS